MTTENKYYPGQWVSVKDLQPSTADDYLVWVKSTVTTRDGEWLSGCYVAFYNGSYGERPYGDWLFNSKQAPQGVNVTHWRELPKGPINKKYDWEATNQYIVPDDPDAIVDDTILDFETQEPHKGV